MMIQITEQSRTFTIWELLASSEDDLVCLGWFEKEPTMNNVLENEYRGYTIVVHKYEFDLSFEIALSVSGYTEEDLDEGFTNEEDVWNSLEIDDLINLKTDDYSDYVLTEISRINEESDQLLEKVSRKLAQEIGIRYWDKYQTIYIDDEGNMFPEWDEDRERKQIRLADHTHNPANGRSDLTVVIAEKDATRGRFRGTTDLVFDEESDVDEIVEAILNYFK